MANKKVRKRWLEEEVRHCLWGNLGEMDHLWANLVEMDRFWANLGGMDHLWANLVEMDLFELT